jgi:ectoine hydroxylase-related dioxygenase (phytanoyl-CoA dioxygenase family)
VTSPPEPVISAERRRELDERGLFFTDVLFTPDEISAVRAECTRVYRQTLTPTTPEHQRVRPFLPEVHRQSEVVARFAMHRVFRALAREIIGPDVDQVWNQACIKLPDAGGLTEFPYHQDAKFAALSDMETGFSCFIALGPLTVENGTLHFASRAHKSALPHTWNADANWWQCGVDEYEIVPGVLSPGQMVVYHPMTPHGSPPNRATAPREAFLLGFGRPLMKLVATGELFGDQRPLLRAGEAA